jgi:hypothetical protein
MPRLRRIVLLVMLLLPLCPATVPAQPAPADGGFGIPIDELADRFNAMAARQQQDVRARTRDCGSATPPEGRTRTCMLLVGSGLPLLAVAMPDHRTLQSFQLFLESRGSASTAPLEFIAAAGVLIELAEPSATLPQRRATWSALFPGGTLPPRSETALRATRFTRATMEGVRTWLSAERGTR